MRQVRKALISAAAALAAIAVVLVPSPDDDSARAELDSEEQAFLTLVNNYRQQNGLVTLVPESMSEAAAVWMSGDMGANAYFNHTDSLGRDPWTRMCDFGYCFNTWKGENLAAGTSSATTAFNLWKDSPGHNANMLNANFRVIGIGRVYTAGSPYGWYWTTDFGGYIPPSPTPAPSPSPAPTATPAPSPTPSPTPAPSASPTPAPSDLDGDGFTNAIELTIATNLAGDCGDFDMTKPGNPSKNWPADLAAGASANKVDLADVLSFISPVRRINTSPGDEGYDLRWDLSPGAGAFPETINLQDLTTVITVTAPMFAGARAFGGPSCS